MKVNVNVEVLDGVAHIAIDPGAAPGAGPAPRLGKIDISAEFAAPDPAPAATPATAPAVTTAPAVAPHA